MYKVAPVDIPNGFNVESEAGIRKETGMITMPCGRINKSDLAEKFFEEEKNGCYNYCSWFYTNYSSDSE